MSFIFKHFFSKEVEETLILLTIRQKNFQTCSAYIKILYTLKKKKLNEKMYDFKTWYFKFKRTGKRKIKIEKRNAQLK